MKMVSVYIGQKTGYRWRERGRCLSFGFDPPRAYFEFEGPSLEGVISIKTQKNLALEQPRTEKSGGTDNVDILDCIYTVFVLYNYSARQKPRFRLK